MNKITVITMVVIGLGFAFISYIDHKNNDKYEAEYQQVLANCPQDEGYVFGLPGNVVCLQKWKP